MLAGSLAGLCAYRKGSWRAKLARAGELYDPTGLKTFMAVATNMRVEVGGAYYIISRSLGLEIGGGTVAITPIWRARHRSPTATSGSIGRSMPVFPVWMTTLSRSRRTFAARVTFP